MQESYIIRLCKQVRELRGCIGVPRENVSELYQIVKDLETWTPTPENINALPRPIREYIFGIETLCDPAYLIQTNTELRSQVEALELRLLEEGTNEPRRSR